MATNDVKEFLSDMIGGEPSDWKRLSKKKDGNVEIRVFQNTISQDQYITSENDRGDVEFFPIGEIVFGFMKSETDPESFIHGVDTDSPYYEIVTVPESDLSWDQHMEHWIKIMHPNALKMDGVDFDEAMECTFEIRPYGTSVGLEEIKSHLTANGLKFSAEFENSLQ